MDKDKKFGGVSGTFTIDETATPFSKDNIGWICPVCGRGVAPTEKFCPCTIRGKRVATDPIDDYPSIYPVYPWTYPTYPIWYGGPMCDAVNVWPRSTEKVTKVTTSTNGETNG